MTKSLPKMKRRDPLAPMWMTKVRVLVDIDGRTSEMRLMRTADRDYVWVSGRSIIACGPDFKHSHQNIAVRRLHANFRVTWQTRTACVMREGIEPR